MPARRRRIVYVQLLNLRPELAQGRGRPEALPAAGHQSPDRGREERHRAAHRGGLGDEDGREGGEKKHQLKRRVELCCLSCLG